jgi:formate dehydrogenase subunit gamma
MTGTPGSGTRTARPESHYLPRFAATERWFHWLNAVGFFAMLGSGLVLYIPALEQAVGRRGTVKAVHLGVAIGWLTALAIAAVVGNRRVLRRTIDELDQFDEDDRRWLLRRLPAPQGRLNAGQKIHSIVQAAFAVLFVVSGTLLWLSERDTIFRLPGTIGLHDGLMFVASALVLGHLWLALVSPSTRPALRGMVRGSVRADWAGVHHAKWAAAALPEDHARARVGIGSVALAACVLALGTATGAYVIHDALSGGGVAPGAIAAAAAPPSGPGDATPASTAGPPPTHERGFELASQAQALDQAGNLANGPALGSSRMAPVAAEARIPDRSAEGAALEAVR